MDTGAGAAPSETDMVVEPGPGETDTGAGVRRLWTGTRGLEARRRR